MTFSGPRCLLAVIAFAAFAAVGCAPPKVLVSHSYASSDKSISTLIEKSGTTVKDGNDNEKNLFNVYMRVCDQSANNDISGCKDTLVLSNVVPESI